MADFRFKSGDKCYVRKWPVDSTVLITKGILSRAEDNMPLFPHYFCVCSDGHEWRIPQIHLSSVPIVEKK